MIVLVEKWKQKEYDYGFKVTQWKHVGLLVELVCKLTEYESNLEKSNYGKKCCKSYDI